MATLNPAGLKNDSLKQKDRRDWACRQMTTSLRIQRHGGGWWGGLRGCDTVFTLVSSLSFDPIGFCIPSLCLDVSPIPLCLTRMILL
jgi:hypothetical protein